MGDKNSLWNPAFMASEQGKSDQGQGQNQGQNQGRGQGQGQNQEQGSSQGNNRSGSIGMYGGSLTPQQQQQQ